MATSINSVERAVRLYDSTIGKKAVMAVTGVVLFGFVLAHLVGNLQIFIPANSNGLYKIDEYAKMLHSMPAVLWAARLTLLTSVILHIWSSIALARTQNRARPVGYAKKDNAHSSYASRTMMLSGPIIAVFIIYHLLHFTGGQVHPDYQEMSVHQNVVRGFQQIPASLFYILAMTLLGFHLNHGLWSLFQSLGISHPRYTPYLKGFAQVFSFLIVAGNISMPLAILFGLVK